MPTWIEQLKPASFKNVPFQVDTIDVSAGDNLVVREYPFQDLPTVFRMGTAAEEIKFSAYVIGDDYIDQREALRDALTGVGVLIHPTAGAMRVAVAGKVRITEAPTSEGGMARFELSFVRAEDRRYPIALDSAGTGASTAAAMAKLSAEAEFANRFSLAGLPGWVNDQVIDRLGASLDTAWDAIQGASATLSDVQSGLIGGYQALRGGLNQLANTPRELASQIGLLFALPQDMSRAAKAGFLDAFSGLFDIGSKVADGSFHQAIIPAVASPTTPVMFGIGDPVALTLPSPARQALAAQRACIDTFVATLATAAYVELVSDMQIDSYEQALAIRAAVFKQCGALLSSSSAGSAPASQPGSNWHDAILAMMSACLADLQSRGFDATRMMSWTPQRWMPVWSVSHELYGTAKYADEVLALNPHIQHPLLVPPGRPLKVLRHG
jgi:prophage DNA circulation protein